MSEKEINVPPGFRVLVPGEGTPLPRARRKGGLKARPSGPYGPGSEAAINTMEHTSDSCRTCCVLPQTCQRGTLQVKEGMV